MPTQSTLPQSSQLFLDRTATLGFSFDVIEMSDSTRTAEEAAQAVGCTVAQICKSLLFCTKESKKPIMIIASGVNRVDQKKFTDILGEPLDRPDADFVREHTGYAIGGVPPAGHDEQIETYIDEDLFQYDAIWAAAGTPRTVFKLTPNELKELTKGETIKVI